MKVPRDLLHSLLLPQTRSDARHDESAAGDAITAPPMPLRGGGIPPPRCGGDDERTRSAVRSRSASVPAVRPRRPSAAMSSIACVTAEVERPVGDRGGGCTAAVGVSMISTRGELLTACVSSLLFKSCAAPPPITALTGCRASSCSISSVAASAAALVEPSMGVDARISARGRPAAAAARAACMRFSCGCGGGGDARWVGDCVARGTAWSVGTPTSWMPYGGGDAPS